MASPYVTLLRTPHAWPFSLAGFVARLPLSMGGLALLLLIVDMTDSYFWAGAVDATWIVVGAFAAPGIAMMIDRLGQRTVIGPQMCVHVVAVVTILVLVSVDAPLWALFVAAAVAGAALPVVGSAVRARWSYVLEDAALVRTAYSWESVVDEFVFVVGPPIVAVVAATLGAAPAVALTCALGAMGTAALLAQRSTEPPARPVSDHGGRLALRYPGMPTVVVVMVMLGLVFAGMEVTVIATARESGLAIYAGVVLAMWSISSMASGLVIGTVRRLPPLHVQLIVGSLATTVLLLPLFFVHSLPGIAVVLFVAGAGVSPALIAGFALASRLVPAAALTQSLTWTSTSTAVGFAAGSAASGWLVDHSSVSAGFWVAITGGALAVVAAVAGRHGISHEYVEPGESADDSFLV